MSETKSTNFNISKIAPIIFKLYNQQTLNVNDIEIIIQTAVPILTKIGTHLCINDQPIITNSLEVPVKKNKKKNRRSKK
jgi:hypothetical protein